MTERSHTRAPSLFRPAPHQIWKAWGLGIKVFSVMIAVALLIVSAKIQVPFWPVPLTMQSAVVLLLPCILGLRAGIAAIALYLGLGFAGYPVFATVATAAAGPAYLLGPTGGYLTGFVAATLLIGAAYERWVVLRRSLPLFALFLGGHAVILAMGVLWLAYGAPSAGINAAITTGLTPFLFGTVAKSALAVMCVQVINKHRKF